MSGYLYGTDECRALPPHRHRDEDGACSVPVSQPTPSATGAREVSAVEALERLADQAWHTAGDPEDRERVHEDRSIVLAAIAQDADRTGSAEEVYRDVCRSLDEGVQLPDAIRYALADRTGSAEGLTDAELIALHRRGGHGGPAEACSHCCAFRSDMARILGARTGGVDGWPCDDYLAPLTCWTTPKPKTLICEGCREAFPQGAEVQSAYPARTSGGGALREDESGHPDHTDPYCATHCAPGIKHSQCACTRPHAARATRPAPDDQAEGEARGCTCGPNGTLQECARELAAGGWCPRADEVRAAARAAQPDGEGSDNA